MDKKVKNKFNENLAEKLQFLLGEYTDRDLKSGLRRFFNMVKDRNAAVYLITYLFVELLKQNKVFLVLENLGLKDALGDDLIFPEVYFRFSYAQENLAVFDEHGDSKDLKNLVLIKFYIDEGKLK